MRLGKSEDRPESSLHAEGKRGKLLGKCVRKDLHIRAHGGGGICFLSDLQRNGTQISDLV